MLEKVKTMKNIEQIVLDKIVESAGDYPMLIYCIERLWQYPKEREDLITNMLTIEVNPEVTIKKAKEKKPRKKRTTKAKPKQKQMSDEDIVKAIQQTVADEPEESVEIPTPEVHDEEQDELNKMMK